MTDGDVDVEGFGLVEVVIAVLLLAIIALALLPSLWQGVMASTKQSSTATATRYMNSIVEDARDIHTCAYLGSIKSLPAINDGRGVPMTTSDSSVTGCSPGSV